MTKTMKLITKHTHTPQIYTLNIVVVVEIVALAVVVEDNIEVIIE
jgi:hypothetical protein